MPLTNGIDGLKYMKHALLHLPEQRTFRIVFRSKLFLIHFQHQLSTFNFLWPPAAKPRYSLNVRHKPSTNNEYDGDEDQDIIVPAKYASSETQMHKLIIVQHRIVTDKEDHRVLAYEVDDGNAGQVCSNEQARETAQYGGNINEGNEDVARKLIVRHHIRSIVEHEIAGNEEQYQGYRHMDGSFLTPSPYNSTPRTPKLKEEDSHEHVVQTKPQGVLQGKQPIRNKGEYEVEQRRPVTDVWGKAVEQFMTPFLKKMDQDVGRKETYQEPCRIVAIETAVFPHMRPFEWFNGIMEALYQER